MPALLVPIKQGKPIALDKPIVLVGRHPDCDAIILNSRKISRKHCAIALVNNHFVVRDLGSMNGLWVNGERVEQQSSLDFGDELVIGDVAFTLQADKAAGVKSKPAAEAAVAKAPELPDTPPAPAKAMSQPGPIPARQPALISPPRAELSMEFPVPIDDDGDDDGFNVPPPLVDEPQADKPAAVGDTDQEDDFIPLKEH